MAQQIAIVLARIETDQVIVKQGRIDIGERHTFAEVPKPVSLMWLNEGTVSDVVAAKRFASKEGYSVFTYPVTESQPLQRARKDIMKETR